MLTPGKKNNKVTIRFKLVEMLKNETKRKKQS